MSSEIEEIQARIDAINAEHASRLAELNAEKVKLQEELRAVRESKRQEGQKLLSEAVKNTEESLAAAQKIADEYGLTFTFSPAYGMGGTYYGKNRDGSDWTPSDTDDGWYSSSMSC